MKWKANENGKKLNGKRMKMAASRRPKTPSVYVLQCTDNKYYVGYTTSLGKRIAAHFAGNGAQYTRQHRPIKTVLYKEGTPFDELKITLRYMKKYGVENVRGSCWCGHEILGSTVQILQDIVAYRGYVGHIRATFKDINRVGLENVQNEFVNELVRNNGRDRVMQVFEQMYNATYEVCYNCGSEYHYASDCPK